MKKQEKNRKPEKPSVKKRKPAGRSLSRVNDKGLEESLRKNKENFPGLLEKIDIGYFELDLRGNYTFFNDVLCRKMGYSREELLGMNYRIYSKPEDTEFLKGLYQEIYRTGKPKTTINIVVIKKDGSEMIVEQSISLKRDPSGEAVGFQVVALEITERINAELALIKSEEKYRTILETMEEGLFENDLKGNYTFVNEAACRLLGYERNEMIGMNYRRLFSPEVAKNIYKAYHEIYKTGEPKFLLDFEVIRKDGSVRIHQANAALLKDSFNKPKGFRILVRDVTERKQSEEKYRIILETMEEGYFQVDLEGRMTFVNDAACRLMGYKRDELLGASYQKIHTPEVARYLRDIYFRIYKTGNPEFMIVHDIILRDGTVRIHQSNAALLRDPSGKPTGLSIFVQDVTEQKKAEEALRQSEEQYRMIAENVYDMIWTTDLNLKCTYVSPSVFRITGFTPQEFQGKPVNEIVTSASFEVIANMLSEELVREKNGNVNRDRSRTLEIEMIAKNGETIWAEVSATFSRDESGQVNGILGVTRDISERKQSEKDKARLEEQLLQAQKMESVGRLAGGVAHDFNNMLSVILGYAELIKLNLPQGDLLLLDVMEIEKAAVRSRDITRQLLAFSRKQIIAPALVDLNDLIMGIQKTLSRLIGEDIDLQFFPADDLWKIKFDPSQIQQILLNLAANARDAMPNGGRLTIETRNIYLDEAYCKLNVGFSPGHYVLLGVSDDGAGMSREILQHVFEPFFTTKETGKGTGLGLATVYGIVRQNEGFINVYSEPGKGTTFKIYIPRSTEEGETPEKVEEAAVASGSGTVLLVEDDEMVRKMTTEMLEAIGYAVLPTGDPAEARALCENNDIHIDLLITDVVMPGMSGRELRDRIEAIRPEIKVLFMSGYTSNVIVHRGVLEEGVHFIQKPFSMSDLARNVRKAIDHG